MNDPTSVRLQDLRVFVRDAHRVCPKPLEWQRLFERLSEGVEDTRPPTPLVLAGWALSSDQERADRLDEQLDWAATHGRIDMVEQFLRNLPEEAWHHHAPGWPRF